MATVSFRGRAFMSANPVINKRHFFLLFRVLPYHGWCAVGSADNCFVRRAGIYVRHTPPFYVPSTSLLCAFFETPLTATKPAICLFYAKPLENQPINPFSPIRPIRPINSHHSHPSHPSFFFHSPRCHRVPALRPLSGHSMPAILRSPSPCRPSASAPTSYPMPAPSAPPPSQCVSRFPRDLQPHPPHPAH